MHQLTHKLANRHLRLRAVGSNLLHRDVVPALFFGRLRRLNNAEENDSNQMYTAGGLTK